MNLSSRTHGVASGAICGRGTALAVAALLVVLGGASTLLLIGRHERLRRPVVQPRSWVLRVTTARAAVTDAAGRRWSPETDASGGQLITASAPVKGTGSPQLYRQARVGPTSYRFPVPATGRYAVDLAFVETEYGAPRRRVFDVTAVGVRVATALDIYARAGRDRPYHLLFTVPVSKRTLDIHFTPRVGQPVISTVQIGYQSPHTDPRLTWEDEFTGPADVPPNAHWWRPEAGGNGWGNNELEYYTDRPANAHLDGSGQLQIVARAERYDGPDGHTRGYTSARLNSKGHFSFQYGLIQARVKMPAGKGLWPGFWAMGADLDQVGWPACGEIDIMEGNGAHPDSVFGSLHGPDRRMGSFANGAHPDSVFGSLHGPDRRMGSFAKGNARRGLSPGRFHTYSALWTPLGIRIDVDGFAYQTVTPQDLPATATWVFDKPFFLLLNLAVGGTMPGPPDATTRFPTTMTVGYVRVYQ